MAMMLLKKIKIWGLNKKSPDKSELCNQILWYPSNRDAQASPNCAKPTQPPLMVRKAAWRK
ncbi:MAG TPA: hypothetical protein DDW84_06455 [Phycisphaerales bacterium]|nr:hypothetical protein [Phycisphaerales bacterium]